jgi:asparagine synthase (glutamine-hydrolysing)
MLRQRRFGRLLRDLLLHVVLHRQFPLPSSFLKRPPPKPPEGTWDRIYPEWISPELESRLQLRARWDLIQRPSADHPIRPKGYASFDNVMWQASFEGLDPGKTKSPYEVRHPFVDVRMLRFQLSVPPVPWCRSKYLMSRAMRGILPEPILQRAKSGYPNPLIVEREAHPESGPLLPARNFGNFVQHNRLEGKIGEGPWAFGNVAKARSLNHWLQYSREKPSA